MVAGWAPGVRTMRNNSWFQSTTIAPDARGRRDNSPTERSDVVVSADAAVVAASASASALTSVSAFLMKRVLLGSREGVCEHPGEIGKWVTTGRRGRSPH